MGISFNVTGDWSKTERYLNRVKSGEAFRNLDRYGEKGCRALAAATPRESGVAAESWTYDIKRSGGGVEIVWRNTNIEKGFQVVIALQYGYGTGTGGYVQGRDYINPAIKPIFDEIERDVWKEMTR